MQSLGIRQNSFKTFFSTQFCVNNSSHWDVGVAYPYTIMDLWVINGSAKKIYCKIRKIFPSRINVSLLCCAMVSEATFTFQIIFRMKNYILSQPSTKKCLLLTIYIKGCNKYKKKIINHKYTTLKIFSFV